ncbi:MAG: SdrD B-like domain-containing protein, partial [Rhodanobacter sp.]
MPDGTEETGVANVTVTLTGTDDRGQPVALTASTDANGNYSFDGLRAGTYRLVETQPTGLLPGPAVPGTGTASAGTASSDGNTMTDIVLGVGELGRDFDFGEWVPNDLTGSVFIDANNDGVRDAGEKGIPGVSIHLTGTDADGNPVDQTVLTGSDGGYAFSNLPKAGAGGYTLTETQPAGYLDGKPIAGLVDGVACATCQLATINRIASIPFDPVQTFTGFDFAELGQGSVSGIVYHDLNNNTQPDASEGIAGVTVTLTGTDDQGKAINRVINTAADGSYRFDDLRPGNYTVTETQPVIYKDGGVQVGSAGGTAGTNLVEGVVLGGGVDATGYHFPELAGADGSIAGTVWLNRASGNPLSKDPGEVGLQGWIVELYRDGVRVAQVD